MLRRLWNHRLNTGSGKLTGACRFWNAIAYRNVEQMSSAVLEIFWNAVDVTRTDLKTITGDTLCLTAPKSVITIYNGEKTWSTNITVCTVMQDCCKGRSNKYRKWHFWGVLPSRNPLTDQHEIWHGWLRSGYHSTPQMACQSDKGRDPHEWVKC